VTNQKKGNTNIIRYNSEIYDVIVHNQYFMITAHVRADGDALGSEIALYYALQGFKKSVFIMNDSSIPHIYQFIIPENGLYSPPQELPYTPEVIFCMDCPELERIGKVEKYLTKDTIIINIDHHISNGHFGNINWVERHVSSTGEMVLALLRQMNISITPMIATAIYVAIITDTGRFTHSNTTPETLRAAAFLIERGAQYEEVSKYVYNTNSYELLQLHAKVLNTIKLHLGNKVATVFLTREMIEKAQVDPVDTHEFADIPVSIDGVSVGVLLRDMKTPNLIKVSLRSRNGFNVNNVAKKFGGGGHKYAAGCEVEGTIEDVQRLILTELKNSLSEKG